MTRLKFNVAQLLREAVGGRRDYEFTETVLPLDDTLALHTIRGGVQFTRTTGGVFAHITAAATVRLVCVRSLEEFDHPLELTIKEEIHSAVDITSGASLPKPTEEDPFFLTNTHIADVEELVREYALLALPLKPIAEAYRDQHITYTTETDQHDAPSDDDSIDKRLAILKTWVSPSSTG